MRLTHNEFKTAEAVKTPAITGICGGTTILTMKGEMAIDRVLPGDRIITRDCGMTVVKDVTAEKVTVAPIRIKAGSLGHTRPDRDMIVAPDAQIHIRDWRAEALFGKTAASVAAKRLVDGEFLETQEPVEMTVYTLVLDREHIIYADGVEMIAGA